MIGIPVGWASVVALFIPILTALAVKERGADDKIHALFGCALTGLVAVVGMLTDSVDQHTVPEVMASFLSVFLPMLGSYLGFWRPVVDVNAKLLPDRGI